MHSLAPSPPPLTPFSLPVHCYRRAHIVCLTESWLDKVVGNQEVCLDASALSIEREIDMAKVWQWQFTVLYTVSWLKVLMIILYHCHVPVQVTSFFFNNNRYFYRPPSSSVHLALSLIKII